MTKWYFSINKVTEKSLTMESNHREIKLFNFKH